MGGWWKDADCRCDHSLNISGQHVGAMSSYGDVNPSSSLPLHPIFHPSRPPHVRMGESCLSVPAW